jgi:hypothetical protein
MNGLNIMFFVLSSQLIDFCLLSIINLILFINFEFFFWLLLLINHIHILIIVMNVDSIFLSLVYLSNVGLPVNTLVFFHDSEISCKFFENDFE